METRTNIVLDDALIEQAMRKAGVTTKKAAIEAALRAFIREPDWDFVMSLEGSGAVDKGYSPQGAFAADPDLAWAVAEPSPPAPLSPATAQRPAGGAAAGRGQAGKAGRGKTAAGPAVRCGTGKVEGNGKGTARLGRAKADAPVTPPARPARKAGRAR